MIRNKIIAVLGVITGLMIIAAPAGASHTYSDTDTAFTQPAFQGDWDPFAAEIPDTPGNDDEADVGICVIGVDSPCNSPPWNTIDNPDAPIADPAPQPPAPDPEPGPVPDNPDDGNNDDEADVGVCVIGVDSPCNSPPWDGSGNISR